MVRKRRISKYEQYGLSGDYLETFSFVLQIASKNIYILSSLSEHSGRRV